MQHSIPGWLAVVVVGLVILVAALLFWRAGRLTQQTTPEIQKGQKAMPPGGMPPGGIPSAQNR